MALVRDDKGNLRFQSGPVNVPWTLGPERAQALGMDLPPMPGLTDASRGAVAGPGGGLDPRMGSEDFNVPPSTGAPPTAPPSVALPRATPRERAAHDKELAGTVARLQGEAKARADAAMAAAPESKGSAESRYAGGKPSYLGNYGPDPKAPTKGVGHFGAQESDELPDAHETPGSRVASSGGGGSARLIPGKMQLAGYSRQVGAPKEDLAAVNAANESSAEAEGQSLGAQAMGETIRNANQMQSLGRQIEHKQALVGDAERRINNARAEYDQAQAEINNERGKVDSLDKDPHRYFAGNGSVAKIIGLISAAVGGGIQSGLNKSGRNPYLDGIQKIVAEDNAEHRRRIDVRRGAVNLNQKQLDARMAKFDPDTAQRENEADKLAIAAAMDQKFSLATKNAEIIAASNARAEALKAEAARIRAENDMKLGDQITEKHMMTADRVVGGAPKVNENDVQALARDYEKAGLGAKEGKAGGVHDLLSQLPEGEIPTPESRNIISRAARWVTDAAAGAGASAKAFDSPAERNAAAALARIKNEKLHELSGAAVSPSEMERLSQGFNELTDRAGVERWVNEADRLVQRQSASVKAGYRPEVVQTFEDRQRQRAPSHRSGARRAE